MRLRELSGDLIEAGAQSDAPRASHEQTERNGLGIAVGELRVVGLREQQLPPVGGQSGKGRTAEGQLFGNFIAEQSTEASRELRQFLCVSRRESTPPAEKVGQAQEIPGGA